jgi:dihydrofolate reductase
VIEVVYSAAASVDGYIATPDGGVGWLEPFHGQGEDSDLADFYASVEALLLGSRTYEVALGLGPWRGADRPSWVFTRRSLPVAHPSITLTPEEPEPVLEALRQRGLKRAWLMGGGRLAASFRHRGLLSSRRITVVPVVLGGGIPLFADAPRRDRLTLIEARPYPSGVVQLSYEIQADR